MARVIVRPIARREISNILVHYIEAAGIEVGQRFQASAIQTFRDLSEFPLLGSPRRVRKPELKGLRMWRVRGFESYLVFYRPVSNGIAVERIIHASRDYRRVVG